MLHIRSRLGYDREQHQITLAPQGPARDVVLGSASGSTLMPRRVAVSGTDHVPDRTRTTPPNPNWQALCDSDRVLRWGTQVGSTYPIRLHPEPSERAAPVLSAGVVSGAGHAVIGTPAQKPDR